MPTRYKKKYIVVNDSEYYAPLRQSRDLKTLRQYGTFPMRNPSLEQRMRVKTIDVQWTYGDRLYKMAHSFYGDSRYWWVIAWWNGYGLEADIKTGAYITIPVNIEEALKALGY